MAKTPLKFVSIEFDTGTEFFYEENSSVPVDAPSGYPVLKSINQAAATLIPTGGLGAIASLSMSFADFDYHVGAITKGTFFGRLRAGNKYYLDKLVNLYTGFVEDFNAASGDYGLTKQVYYLDRFDFPNGGGVVNMQARDISKKLDDKRAVVPQAVKCKLVGENEQHQYLLVTSTGPNDSGLGAQINGVETGSITYDGIGATPDDSNSYITVTSTITPDYVEVTARNITGSTQQWLVGFQGQFGSIMIDSSNRPQVVVDGSGTLSTNTYVLPSLVTAQKIEMQINNGNIELYVADVLRWSSSTYTPTESTGWKFFRRFDDTNQSDAQLNDIQIRESRSAGISDTYTGLVTVTDTSDLLSPNYILIDKELIRYSVFDSSNIRIHSITDRGILNRGVNVAAIHENNAAISQAWLTLDESDPTVKKNCVDLIQELLETAGVPTANIDTVGFADEKSTWLSNENLAGAITKPTSIKNVIKKISEQCYFDIWYEPTEQKYKLAANVPQVVGTLTSIDTDADILENGHTVKHELKDQATQVWVYSNKLDVLGSDQPNNYSETDINADLGSETNYGSSSKKIIYADFFDDDSSTSVDTIGNRYRQRLVDGVITVLFQLDISNNQLKLNDKIVIRTTSYTDDAGEPVPLVCQITKYDNTRGNRIFVEAQKLPWDADQKFAGWAANALNDYSSESEENKIKYSFWSDNTGLLPDGSSGYNWA